jgi:hypothetical protein
MGAEVCHRRKNEEFMELFWLSKEDQVVEESKSCRLLLDSSLHKGTVYISKNYLCFYSRSKTFETKVSVSQLANLICW